MPRLRPLVAVVTATASLLAVSGSAHIAGASAAARVSTDRIVQDTRIAEHSGLAPSTRFAGVLWMHNDTGHPNQVFAVGPTGHTRAVVKLRGARNVDWEDITVGRGNHLWVGDIGDNSRSRGKITLYRFKEPSGLGTQSVGATGFDFRYPDGAKDAEGLMMNRRSGEMYVVTKAADRRNSAVYRAPRPWSTDRVNRLVRVASAPLSVTAADWAPNGKRFVLRDYDRAHIFRQLGAPAARTVSLPSQPQGESIAFGGRNTVLIGSERSRQPIFRVPL